MTTGGKVSSTFIWTRSLTFGYLNSNLGGVTGGEQPTEPRSPVKMFKKSHSKLPVGLKYVSESYPDPLACHVCLYWNLSAQQCVAEFVGNQQKALEIWSVGGQWNPVDSGENQRPHHQPVVSNGILLMGTKFRHKLMLNNADQPSYLLVILDINFKGHVVMIVPPAETGGRRIFGDQFMAEHVEKSSINGQFHAGEEYLVGLSGKWLLPRCVRYIP
ncbi:hypothetical protein C8R44DRAFT_751287 [Mycena epipterygia]|nr:hypothetical protein C8R44DRAFT_751287 [Mycena epipterygia]